MNLPIILKKFMCHCETWESMWCCTRQQQVNAYKKALKCDPVSAFGGIVAFNKKLDEQTSTEILKIFTEVVIAPDFSLNAKKLLSQKKILF